MPLRLTRRGFASLLATTPFLAPARAEESWAEIEAQARGQTVYFNAWAGSPQVNAYIAWVADEVNTRYGITLEHVKLTDTAEAVRRVRDEVMVPVVCYNVSGEYSLVKTAAAASLVDEANIVRENLLAFRRAGADIIITYHAREALAGEWI